MELAVRIARDLGCHDLSSVRRLVEDPSGAPEELYTAVETRYREQGQDLPMLEIRLLDDTDRLVRLHQDHPEVVDAALAMLTDSAGERAMQMFSPTNPGSRTIN